MLGGGIAGEMQDFRHVEHIIRASKAPFGWSALVSQRDSKSPHRPQEVSEALFGSCEEEHPLFRKLNVQICVNEYSSLSHRKRDGPQGPSLFLLWLLIGLRSPAGGIAAVDHENSHAYQYQCR